MKKAIVVFTKVPKVGDIKTRLTTDKGGILTPEEAKDIYEAFLLDVIDACVDANTADVWLCYNQKGDRQYFDKLINGLTHPEAIKGVFSDQGGTFDECIQYAGDYILKKGQADRLADAVLFIGGDLPGLQPLYIRSAFDKLEKLSASPTGQKVANKIESADSIGAAVVEGSCQEGGFSIVGFTCTTPFDFHGVFYNQEGSTALDKLVEKVAAAQIPFGVIQNVPDVDIPVDLASILPELGALSLASQYDDAIVTAKRTLAFLEEMGIVTTTSVNHRDLL